MPDTTIERDLCEFIGAHSLGDRGVEAETDLLEAGVLESMFVFDLVSHIESRHGVALADTDITPGNFRQVRQLAELIASRKSASG